MTDFKCNCGAKFSVPDNAVGKKGRCPKCNQVVTIEKPIAELEWNDDAMPFLKKIGKIAGIFFGTMFALCYLFEALGIDGFVLLNMSFYAIVTVVWVSIYRMTPSDNEDGRGVAVMLGLVMYGALIYAQVTYVPPHERPKPVSYASSSSSSSGGSSPSSKPAGWSDADQNALEGAIITKMILEQQGYDSQTADDVAIRTWAFD